MTFFGASRGLDPRCLVTPTNSVADHYSLRFFKIIASIVPCEIRMLAPIRDSKTTVRRGEFFTPFDRGLLSDFNYI